MLARTMLRFAASPPAPALLATALLALGLASVALPAQNLGLRLTAGTDVYLDAPYDPTLIPRSGVTVEAWITYDDRTLPPGVRYPTIVRQNSSPGNECFVLRIEAGAGGNTNITWSVRTSAGLAPSYSFFNSGTLATWTHVAATYDGLRSKLYLNGIEVNDRSVPGGALADFGNSLRIGGGDRTNPGAETWHGGLDEVRLWPFARTPVEIRSTMFWELATVPGEVCTWNLNGNGLDSSYGNHATQVNAPTYEVNPLNLTSLTFFGGFNFGNGTAGCRGTPGMVATTLPTVGNADFALGVQRSTISGAGVFWLGTANLTTPINLLGASLWLNPARPNVIVSIRGGPIGFARIPLPIPNVRSLANAPLYAQTVWSEVGCTVPLFASDALQFNVLR